MLTNAHTCGGISLAYGSTGDGGPHAGAALANASVRLLRAGNFRGATVPNVAGAGAQVQGADERPMG